MTNIRLTLAALVALLALSACGDRGDTVEATSSSANNPLLSHVPANTPYVFANLEPVPNEVIDTYLLRAQPLLDSMQSQLGTARVKMESTQAASSGDAATRFAHAMLVELDGKLSREGLESMGFDLQSRRVLYGMGAFPAVRMSLSDAQTLRDTITRVMDNAEITVPEQDFQGVPYWRISDEHHGGEPVGLYISIFEDHLAISLFPMLAEAELLPAFLGLEMPPASDAQARLKTLNKNNGYSDYGSGIFDVRKLADELMNPDTPAGKAMAASGDLDPSTLSQVCVAEIREIIDNTPRMTMGIRELSTSAVAMGYRIETPATLGSQLMGLVSKLPAADALTDRILEFSFGMRFGPVRDFVREKAAAISADPYQCEHLAELNTSAAQALEQINQPMPPFLNNFLGLRVSLSEIVMSQDSIPENARGYMAVHVEQPQMFVGMAQMFLPDLSGLAITPGEPAVRLPERLIPVPGMVAFAAMSQDAIGVALGEGEQDGLPGYLDQDAGPEGTFLSASYDMAAYLDYSDKLSTHYKALAASAGDAHQWEPEAAREISESARKAFRDMADRNHTYLRFTADGLEIENRMTFK
ncbi:MAG: hypothetical protein HKN57_05620 [Xanthomonadales bacterium]|nr:hypothetical protein [Gammaproteobacteria bacterium]NND56711.1 hypothetical protein [Xanthomonadales bacterium]NNK52696.1 hypothetical protein [Xanthomonadales bacterium]